MRFADWVREHLFVIGPMALVGLYLLATGFGIAFVLAVPKDYFARRRRYRSILAGKPSFLRVALRVCKNLAGLGLIVVGVVLLVVPGPGILTMLIGIVCVDFPGKFRLESWMVGRPAVFHTLNRLRNAAGRQPFDAPRRGSRA